MATSFQGFRSIIENSPDAISLIDTDGEILYGSASNTKLFGYQPEELLGRNFVELIHPEDRDHSSRALEDVLAKPPGPLQRDAQKRDAKKATVVTARALLMATMLSFGQLTWPNLPGTLIKTHAIYARERSAA